MKEIEPEPEPFRPLAISLIDDLQMAEMYLGILGNYGMDDSPALCRFKENLRKKRDRLENLVRGTYGS